MDHAIPQKHGSGEVATRRTLVLAAMMAIFMAAVESTIVATAMPTIVADFGGFRLFSRPTATRTLPS